MAESSLRHGTLPAPVIGLDTTVVMDHAVVGLADRRFVRSLDPCAQLHLLASLVAQAESWITEQVVLARADGASWAVVGRLLGVPAAVARQRYGKARSPLD